jgi:hypothetical protein
VIKMMRSMSVAFATVWDFESVLQMPEGTRAEVRDKRQAVATGITTLNAIIDEPETLLIDDGPIDPNDPNSEHTFHEIPVLNPMYARYGFASKDEAAAMLVRYEAEQATL